MLLVMKVSAWRQCLAPGVLLCVTCTGRFLITEAQKLVDLPWWNMWMFILQSGDWKINLLSHSATLPMIFSDDNKYPFAVFYVECSFPVRTEPDEYYSRVHCKAVHISGKPWQSVTCYHIVQNKDLEKGSLKNIRKQITMKISYTRIFKVVLSPVKRFHKL